MLEFALYFVKFKEINSTYSGSRFNSRDEWTFIYDIPRVREFLEYERYDVITYGAMLYATNLLSQVIHSNFCISYVVETDSGFRFNEITYLNSDEKRKMVFPEIFGLLSTSYSHICPSVPATQIIYCNQDSIEDDLGGWNKKLERETWSKYHENFCDAIKWVKLNLDTLLPYLLDKKFNYEEFVKINKIIDYEHIRINTEIYNDSSSTRII